MAEVGEVLLHPKEVERRTGLSRSHLERLEQRHLFPKSVRAPPIDGEDPRWTRKFWMEREVDRWIADLIAAWRAGDGKAPNPFVVGDHARRAAEREKDAARRRRHRVPMSELATLK